MRLADLGTDLRHALRSLRRAPAFTALAVGTLALAIGANAGIFSVVDAVLLRPLPYAEPDRLVHIAASAPGLNVPEEFGVSAEFYLQYQEADLLESVSFYHMDWNTLRVGDRSERVLYAMPSLGLFRTLGVEPVLGRLPLPVADGVDDGNVVLISHDLWTTWFDGDPEVIGRSLYVAGEARTIIGVMGPEFWFPDDEVVAWAPYELTVEGLQGTGRFGLPLVARTKPGVTTDALEAELAALARRLPERFGGSARYERLIERHRPVVRPLDDRLVGRSAGLLWLLFGSMGIALLIACANVANLFMVRGQRRRHDHAVRRALGGSRARLIRAGLAESLVVALLAGGLGIFIAWLCVPLYLRIAPDFPRAAEVELSAATVLFTLAVSVVSALLCGLGPALRAAAARLTALREGGRGSTRSRDWRRDGLVVVQTALALVLLVGSALLVRSFLAIRSVDPGYETEDLFTFQFAPERGDLVDGPSYARFHMAFMERLEALPGVESVGVVSNVPLDEGVADSRYVTEAGASVGEIGVPLGYTYAGGDYFATMGIRVLQGRAFASTDHSSELNHVVISRSAAELLWPGEDPIGRRFRPEEGRDWHTVVGVAEDVMQYGFREGQPQPIVYFPLVGPEPTSWSITSPAYVLRTARAGTIAPEIRHLIRQVAPRAPMYRAYTMEELVARETVALRFTLVTLGTTALLALILGAVGLFGVLSFVVAERTSEIGVRMALGARSTRVQGMVVAQGLWLVAIGVASGLALAALGTRILGSLLFGVGPVDPGTFAGMSVTMLGVGLLASYLPARRASRVDPVESLRQV